MARGKIVFKGDCVTTINIKLLDEEKMKYFLDELDKHFVTTREVDSVVVYRSSRKIRDCFIPKGHLMVLFNKWLDYGKKSS